MIKINNSKTLIYISVFAVSFTAFLFVFNPSVNAVKANSTSSTSTSIPSSNASKASLDKLRNAADKQISNRLAQIAQTETKVATIKYITDDNKKLYILDEITEVKNGLSALQTKIDADTDLVTLQQDKDKILSFHVFAYIVPKTELLLANDSAEDSILVLKPLASRLGDEINALDPKTTSKDIQMLKDLLADMNGNIDTATSNYNDIITNDLYLKYKDFPNNKTTIQDNESTLKDMSGEITNANNDADKINTELEKPDLTITSTETPTPTQIISTTPTSIPGSTIDYDGLRAQWKNILTGGSYNLADTDINNKVKNINKNAQTYWTSMDKTSSRSYLWSDIPGDKDPAQITINLDRLKTMALAYNLAGGVLQNNDVLKTDIISGLDWLNANRYNSNIIRYGTWFYWEIGIPLYLNDVTVLMYDKLSATQVSNYMKAISFFSPTVKYTGANRIWLANIVAVRGILTKSDADIKDTLASLPSVLNFSTKGDGFYADGSFIQHGFYPYNEGYGLSLLQNISSIAFLLNIPSSTGSHIDSTSMNTIYQWVYNSYEPLVFKGNDLDMVRGREMSRPWTQDFIANYNNIIAVLQLAQGATGDSKTNLESIAKYWLLNDANRKFFSDAPIISITQAKALLADTTIAPIADPVLNKIFPTMDRVVHLRKDWGLGLSISSNRIYKYETIGGENPNGWYTSDGMMYTYVASDPNQYSGDYWPTVDPYKLPGTTIDTKPRDAASGKYFLGKDWAGGASLDTYGVAGMDLTAYQNSLTAKKSWFMFDNEIVALGAGITDPDNSDVQTTVENRKLGKAGTDTFVVNGTAKPTSAGWNENLTNVTWAYLGNFGGYYFPDGNVSLKASRDKRTATWYDINTPCTVWVPTCQTTKVSNTFLSLLIDHGTNPVNSKYSYVILPNMTQAATASYASNPQVQILNNDSNIQAVLQKQLNITAINFWKSGTISNISSDSPASVIIKQSTSLYEIAVSDPTQKQKSVTITLNVPVKSVASKDTTITTSLKGTTTTLTIDLSHAKGTSQTAKLNI